MSSASISSSSLFTSACPTKSPVQIKIPWPSLTSTKTFSKQFCFKSSSSLRAKPLAAVHKVKLIGPNGEENEYEAPDDTYILDSAENSRLELPYACRVGACCACVGLIVSGSVDQSDGSLLDEEQLEKGYVLTCVAYPKSDVVIHTHKEGELV